MNGLVRSNLLNASAKKSLDRGSEVEGYHLRTESANTCCRCASSDIVTRFSPSSPQIAEMGLQENRIHRRSSCAECVSPCTTFGFAFFGLFCTRRGYRSPDFVSQTKAVKVTDKRKTESKHSDSEDKVEKISRRVSSGEDAGIVKKALQVVRIPNGSGLKPKPPQKYANPKGVKLGTGSRSELKTRFSRPPFSSSSPRAFFDITTSPSLSIHPLHRIQASSHSYLDCSIVCDLDRH